MGHSALGLMKLTRAETALDERVVISTAFFCPAEAPAPDLAGTNRRQRLYFRALTPQTRPQSLQKTHQPGLKAVDFLRLCLFGGSSRPMTEQSALNVAGLWPHCTISNDCWME